MDYLKKYKGLSYEQYQGGSFEKGCFHILVRDTYGDIDNTYMLYAFKTVKDFLGFYAVVVPDFHIESLSGTEDKDDIKQAKNDVAPFVEMAKKLIKKTKITDSDLKKFVAVVNKSMHSSDHEHEIEGYGTIKDIFSCKTVRDRFDCIDADLDDELPGMIKLVKSKKADENSKEYLEAADRVIEEILNSF